MEDKRPHRRAQGDHVRSAPHPQITYRWARWGDCAIFNAQKAASLCPEPKARAKSQTPSTRRQAPESIVEAPGASAEPCMRGEKGRCLRRVNGVAPERWA